MLEISPSNITFVIGILGVIFTVYSYFRNPQVRSDKVEALFKQRMDGFAMELANLRDNHLHSLDVKLDQTNKDVGKIHVEVAKLATIIDERIPRRQ